MTCVDHFEDATWNANTVVLCLPPPKVSIYISIYIYIYIYAIARLYSVIHGSREVCIVETRVNAH